MKSEYEGMNAVLYARVSTEFKDQDTKTQVRNMKKWCEDKGVNILEIYEEKKSGKDTVNRKEYSAMLGNIMSRNMKAPSILEDGSIDPSTQHVDIILAWKANRLSRDLSDLNDLLDMTKYLNVILRFVDEDVHPEESTGRLMYQVYAWQGQQENSNNSVNTKAGINSAKLKGVICGRRYAMVFTEDVSRDNHDPNNPKKSKLQLESHPGKGTKRPKNNVATVIHSIDDVMNYAHRGYTRNQVSKLLKVNRMTLARRLEEHGLLEEYDRISSETRSLMKELKKRCTQTGMHTNVPKDDENLHTNEEE